jgi:hypothetical protein
LALVVPAATGIVFASVSAAPVPAVTNQDCTVVVPLDPLSAKGLATPYQLTATDPKAGPCHEANIDQSAFVQATIIDPATGHLSVYNPLVVDAGTTPAVPPVVPVLPPGSVVGIWFGFNGNSLLQRTSQPSCVNGLPGSPFGQASYCNAPAFFAAAHDAIRAGKLAIPPVGQGKDGRPCPTVRSFGVVDQDQSDNVSATYLATPDGRIAPDTPAAAKVAAGAVRIGNGSDNRLLDRFVDPALGCTPFMAPDLGNPGTLMPSQALNELQAAAHQRAPVALVPVTDPMVLDNGRVSVAKTNAYRAGVDQPPLNEVSATGNGAEYCASLLAVAPARLRLDRPFTTAAPSPQAGVNLHDFLVTRLKASIAILGCRPQGGPGGNGNGGPGGGGPGGGGPGDPLGDLMNGVAPVNLPKAK